jgi:hypothetical protein
MVRVPSEEKQPGKITGQSEWEELANATQLKQSWRADGTTRILDLVHAQRNMSKNVLCTSGVTLKATFEPVSGELVLSLEASPVHLTSFKCAIPLPVTARVYVNQFISQFTDCFKFTESDREVRSEPLVTTLCVGYRFGGFRGRVVAFTGPWSLGSALRSRFSCVDREAGGEIFFGCVTFWRSAIPVKYAATLRVS